MRCGWVIACITSVALLFGGCATTSLGKSIQAASIQKQLVEQATVQIIKQCAANALPVTVCDKAKSDYQKWAVGQQAVADSLAQWAVLQNDTNETKLQAALNFVKSLASDYLTFLGQFVDISAIAAKIGG